MSEDDSKYSVGVNNWISWFCSLEDHSFFCEIEEDFIRESFNIYGMDKLFSKFDQAIEMILSTESPSDDDLDDEK